MSVKIPLHGSETQVGHVGGKTTRFLIVVLRICHSEKRFGYAVMGRDPLLGKGEDNPQAGVRVTPQCGGSRGQRSSIGSLRFGRAASRSCSAGRGSGSSRRRLTGRESTC